MSDLVKTVVIRYKSNAAKLAADARKAAAGTKKLTKSTRESFSALDAHNARIVNAKINAEKARKAELQRLEDVKKAEKARFAAFDRAVAKATAKQRAFQQAQQAAWEAQQRQRELLEHNIGVFARYGVAIAGATAAIERVSQRSLQLNDIQGNLPFSIDRASEATGGLVDRYTLLQKATQANTLGAAKTGEEYARLTKVATKLARAQGLDATKGVEDFTIALARGSPKILDNLGLVLKQSEAEAIFAEHLGISTKRLTASQKAEAFRFAALQKGEEVIKTIQVEEEGLALRIQKTKVEVLDAADAILTLSNRLEDHIQFLNKTSESYGVFSKALNVVGGGALTTGAVFDGALFQMAEGVNLLEEATRGPMTAATEQVKVLTDILAEENRKISEQARVAGQEYQDLAIAITAAVNLDRVVEKNFKKYRKKRRGSEDVTTFFTDAESRAMTAELSGQTADVAGGIGGAGDLGFGRTEQSDALFDDLRARSEAANELAVEQAEKRREMMLEQLEIDRALGLDPAEQAEREAEIAESHHARMIELERKHQASKDQVQKAAHDAQLARIKAEKAAERQRMKELRLGFAVYQQVSNGTMDLAQNVLATTSMSAERQARIANRFKGVEVLGTALQAQVEAIAAFARYDFGAGAQYQAAAVLGFANSALLMSGALDQGGGGGKDVGGFTGDNFGPGRDSGRDSTSERGRAGGLPGPVSRNRIREQEPVSQGGASTAPTSGGKTINIKIGEFKTLTTEREDLGLELRNIIAQSEAVDGGI